MCSMTEMCNVEFSFGGFVDRSIWLTGGVAKLALGLDLITYNDWLKGPEESLVFLSSRLFAPCSCLLSCASQPSPEPFSQPFPQPF